MRSAVRCAALLVLLAGCAAELPRATVEIEGAKRTLRLEVEVAADAASRSRGLMHRTELAGDAGMLFLYPAQGVLDFWMKNTLIPLDIAFIRDGRVVSISPMLPCRRDPCPMTSSREAADSALEVKRGTLARAGVEPGARVRVHGALPSPS